MVNVAYRTNGQADCEMEPVECEIVPVVEVTDVSGDDGINWVIGISLAIIGAFLIVIFIIFSWMFITGHKVNE